MHVRACFFRGIKKDDEWIDWLFRVSAESAMQRIFNVGVYSCPIRGSYHEREVGGRSPALRYSATWKTPTSRVIRVVDKLPRRITWYHGRPKHVFDLLCIICLASSNPCIDDSVVSFGDAIDESKAAVEWFLLRANIGV